MTATGIVEVGRSEHGRAGEVLGRAFHDDPQWARLFPDTGSRLDRLTGLFTGLSKTVVGARGTGRRPEGFQGVALWLPPGRDLTAWAFVRSGFAMARHMRMPTAERKKMTRVLGAIGGQRARLLPEPHWYLLALGVDPAEHGGGWGSSLVRWGLAQADKEGVPVYLEAEAGINSPFYEALGFAEAHRETVEEIDLPFSFMIRRPT